MIESVGSAGAPMPSASGPRVCQLDPPSHLVSCCSGLWIVSVQLQIRGCGVFCLGASGVGSAAAAGAGGGVHLYAAPAMSESAGFLLSRKFHSHPSILQGQLNEYKRRQHFFNPGECDNAHSLMGTKKR